ncbi:hypothetical protein [Streptomyces alkaliphilus]|uniref:Uncharacterized protein n=1 Tax=Streptomyces alkaliphilus TaxID=1472722 RepID=A0A646ICT6_9ACTN|nr:hypothetical protein [Streptomyces alkaliphilus]MQS08511.1 hypothetical protein [Streptomyces alkaliphilus]
MPSGESRARLGSRPAVRERGAVPGRAVIHTGTAPCGAETPGSDPAAPAGARSGYRGGVDAKTRARIVSAALILMFAVVFIATALGR